MSLFSLKKCIFLLFYDTIFLVVSEVEASKRVVKPPPAPPPAEEAVIPPKP
jgi:hypothetical protein